jgi:hypothetical protein
MLAGRLEGRKVWMRWVSRASLYCCPAAGDCLEFRVAACTAQKGEAFSHRRSELKIKYMAHLQMTELLFDLRSRIVIEELRLKWSFT